MAQMTAVEWFAHEINKINASTEAKLFIEKLKNQAKEMEKEQSMNDFMSGKWDWAEHIKGKESKDPAEYYNDTYKTEAHDK